MSNYLLNKIGEIIDKKKLNTIIYSIEIVYNLLLLFDENINENPRFKNFLYC